MARNDDILRAIDRSDTLRSKSSLETWLRQNHDAFAAKLSGRIADWAVLAKMFADANLTDRYGNNPKPETARKTWQRVRQKVAKARAEPPPFKPSPPVYQAPSQPQAAPVAAAAVEPDPPRDRKPMVLRPARTIGPNEAPQDDGSKLPKPIHR